MSLLDCCLAIVEPGYEAPRARAPYEETIARVIPAHALCKTCGEDECKPGRAECQWCIAKSPAAVVERLRANESARERWRLKSQAAREAAAAKKKAGMTPSEAKRYDDEREKRRAGALRAKTTCACGRPAPCSRRICR